MQIFCCGDFLYFSLHILSFIVTVDLKVRARSHTRFNMILSSDSDHINRNSCVVKIWKKNWTHLKEVVCTVVLYNLWQPFNKLIERQNVRGKKIRRWERFCAFHFFSNEISPDFRFNWFMHMWSLLYGCNCIHWDHKKSPTQITLQMNMPQS